MALTLLRTMGRSPCFKQRSLNILTSPGLKPGFRSSATRHHSTSHLTTTSTSQLDLPNLLRFARSVPRAVRNTYFASRPSASGGGKGPSSFFHGFRRRVDALPTNVILYGIVGINAGVFLLWNYANESWRNFQDSQILRWMYKNFTTSLANLQQGRVWTLLTSCFSHEDTSHIVLNLINFVLMAPAGLQMLGNARFLGLYLGGGILSSVISLAYSAATGATDRRSHGASGAIFAVIAFYATLAPTSKFLLFAIVPMPAWLCVGGLAAYDLYGALANPHRRTDSAGHLGGMLGGFLYALRLTGRL